MRCREDARRLPPPPPRTLPHVLCAAGRRQPPSICCSYQLQPGDTHRSGIGRAAWAARRRATRVLAGGCPRRRANRARRVHMLNGGKTHTTLQDQSQARVGCAARSRQGSLDRVSRRRGPRRAAGASLEQRDLLDDVCRVREHSRGHDAGEVVGEVVRRVEAAVGGAVAPALPA